jgi:hypothetical protein
MTVEAAHGRRPKGRARLGARQRCPRTDEGSGPPALRVMESLLSYPAASIQGCLFSRD